MKKVIYNIDGTVKEEQYFKVPERVQYYSGWTPVELSVEDEKILRSRVSSFKKLVLIEQMEHAIKHDYNNFKDSIQGREKDELFGNLERDYSGINSDVQKIINLFEQYERDSKEEPCACIIGDDDELTDLFQKGWLKALFIIAKQDASKERNNAIQDEYDIPNKILAEHFLKNLKRFYHAINKDSGFDSYYQEDNDIPNVPQILYPFTVSAKKLISSESLFGESNDKELYRRLSLTFWRIRRTKEVYKIVYILDTLLGGTASSNTSPSNLISFVRQPVNSTLPPVSIKLNMASGNHIEYQLTSEDRATLCVDCEERNDFLDTIVSDLKDIDGQLARDSIVIKSWKNSLETDIENFTRIHNMQEQAWELFYANRINEYKEQAYYNAFNPQQCYRSIVVQNVQPGKMVEFSREIARMLITTLIENQDVNQTFLYESKYRINYVKEQIEVIRTPKDIYQDAIDKALKYISPLFGSKFVHTNYSTRIESTIRVLLDIPKVYKDMALEKPNGFHGGFNLKMVYNILGFLFSKQVLIKSQSGIDKLISSNNDNAERKHYIIDYNTDKEFKKIIPSLEKKLNEIDQ